MGLDPGTELLVLEPIAGQHGDEAPAGAIDVIHWLARAQFAIGAIKEVGPPGQRAQRVPGVDGGAQVAGVAIGATEGHGHVAVGAHGEDEQQLLEIRAMFFRMTERDRYRATATDRATGGGAVLAAKAHRSAVVVELVELHGEALAHSQGHLGKQCGAVGVEQVVQSATQAVVAEVAHVLGGDAEHRTGKAVDGLVLAVDGFALDDQRAQQNAQGLTMGDAAASVTWDMTLEQLGQAHSLDEVVDQG